MPADLRRVLPELEQIVAQTPLADARSVRRSGEIRRRRQAAAALVAVALTVGAGIVGASALVSRESAPPAASPSPSPTAPTSSSPSVSPTPSAAPSTSSPPPLRPTTIPAGAMLRPEDLGDGGFLQPVGGNTATYLRPPRPCASARYASDADRRGHRAVGAVHVSGGNPDGFLEYLALYRPRGAHRFMTELRDQLARCGGGAWSLVGPASVGDESLLLRYTQPGYLEWVVVARVDNAVVVVANAGWEQGIGDGHRPDRALTKTVAARAVERARVLD